MFLLPDDPAFFHPHERTDLQPIARPRWWRRIGDGISWCIYVPDSYVYPDRYDMDAMLHAMRALSRPPQYRAWICAIRRLTAWLTRGRGR